MLARSKNIKIGRILTLAESGGLGLQFQCLGRGGGTKAGEIQIQG